MKTLKKILALMVMSCLVITLYPNWGKLVAHATVPAADSYFFFTPWEDDPAGTPANMVLLVLTSPDATDSALHASTTYTLKNVSGTTVETAATGGTSCNGGPCVVDMYSIEPAEFPEHQFYGIFFGEAVDATTPNYTMEVNFEGLGASSLPILSSIGASAMFDADITDFPYVFSLAGADGGFGSNEIAVFSGWTENNWNNFSYTKEGSTSLTLAEGGVADISSFMDWLPYTVHVLTFDPVGEAPGTPVDFTNDTTFSYGSYSNLPIHSFAEFQAIVSAVNSDGGGSSSCSGFCVSEILVKADASNVVNTFRVTFTGGPVSEQVLETTTNYRFPGYQGDWGTGIVSATVPQECLSSGNYTCVDVKVNGYIAMGTGFNLGILQGDTGIKNINNQPLDSITQYNSWTYASGSPRILRIVGWDLQYPYYTNGNGKILSSGYVNNMQSWIIGDAFQTQTPVYYGPSPMSSADGSGTYYSDAQKTVTAGSLSCANNECTVTGLGGAYVGTYGPKSYKYSSALQIYLGSANTLNSSSISTAANYSVTIPSGPKAGTYTSNSRTSVGYLANAGFDADTNSLGLFSDAFGADNWTLNVGGICDNQNNCIDEHITFSSFEALQNANQYAYTRSNESLVWSAPAGAVVTVSAPDNSATEGTPSVDTGTYTVSRTGATTDPLSVSFSLTGTATVGDDYSLTTNGNTIPSPLIIPAGQASINVTLTATDDAAQESSETAVLTVTSGVGYTVGNPSSATVTIVDNEQVGTVVSIVAADATADETGQATGSYTISRTGNTGVSVTVGFTMTGGATVGGDYSLTSGGTPLTTSVTIPMGEPSVVVLLTPTDDASSEGSESAIMTLNAGVGYTVDAFSYSSTITITDNETPPSATVTISATDSSAYESGDNATYRISRTGDTASSLTVNFTVAGTATRATDYFFNAGADSTTIQAGNSYIDISTSSATDQLAESDETIVVTLASGSGYVIGNPSAATATIHDGAAPAGTTVTLIQTDMIAEESTPSSNVGVYTISRAPASSGALTVSFSMTGTATSLTDYNLSAGGSSVTTSAVIPDGQQSVQVILTPVDDAAEESTESATMTLMGGAGYSVIGSPNNVATATISDNDSSTPTITVTPNQNTSELETNFGEFKVSRAGSTASSVTVNIALGGGGASEATYTTDYTCDNTTTVTIPAGETKANVTCTAVNDALNEGSEIITMTVQAGAGYNVGTPSSTFITIIDDDTGISNEVTVSTSDSAAAESGTPPTDIASYLFTRSSADNTKPIAVKFAMTGTATRTSDYTLRTGPNTVETNVIYFSAGQNTALLSLLPVDDAIGDTQGSVTENAVLTIVPGNGYTIGAQSNAEISITDNDVSVTIEATDNSAYESGGDNAMFRLTRTGSTVSNLTVNFTESGTAGRGADYGLGENDNNIVIPSGSSYVDLSTWQVADQSVESDETIIITVAAGTGYTPGTPSSATATIHDGAAPVGEGEPEGLTIRGYGPSNGETGVPTTASIDMFFDSDPATDGVSYPFSNQSENAPVQILTGGNAVSGQWISHLEGDYGDYTFYRVAYEGTLLASTSYTVRILKSYITLGLMDGANMPALTDGGSYYTFTFTTGTGGGDYYDGSGSGYQGQTGGQIPPSANLGYPQPGTTVPSNIGAVNVQFDRAMDATTFAGNIYIKKSINGTLSDPPGTLTLSPTTGTSNTVQISGYNFSNNNANCNYQNNCSWVVVVTRDVKDTRGALLAGMPMDAQGNTINTSNFGYANMGPYKANFYTTYSAQSQNLVANLIATSLDQYKTSLGTTGVPVSLVLSASFSNALKISTVTSDNVKVKQGGTPIAGTVSYDSQKNMIMFKPASALQTNTQYEFSISANVKSVSDTAISAISKTFTTTGSADNVAPRLVYAEANNYGLTMQFSEQLDSSKATNKGNYVLKTCASGAISYDGTSCTSGSPATVSLLSANLNYETYDGTSKVRIDGLTLTSNYSYFIQVSTNITDISANAMDGSNRSKTGFVIDCSKTEGGQCLYEMGGTMSMDQYDMKEQMMNPVIIEPFTNTIPGALSKYAVEFTAEDEIENGSFIVISLPQGTNVSGAKRDAESQRNRDFNGGGTGTVTFASSDPTYGDATGGGANNDGIGVISEANKVVVKLNVSGGGSISSGNRIAFDLDGIINTTTANSTGFSVSLQVLDSDGKLIRNKQAMPVPISASGDASLGGRVTNSVSGAGLNGVTIYFGTQNGLIKATTANNANGGGQDGEYKFSNLQSNIRGFLHTDMDLTVGATPYSMAGEDVMVTGSVTKNFSLVPDNGGAVLPVTINVNNIDSIDSFGIDDSIHLFRMIMTSSNGGQGKAYTLTRANLTGGITYNVNISQPGLWNIGIGPATSNEMTDSPQTDWVSDMPSTMVTVEASDVSEGSTLDGITFTIDAVTAENGAEVSGKVLDMSDTAISDYKIIASRPQNSTFKVGPEPNTNTNANGEFSLKLQNGEYEIRAEKGGFPGAYSHVSVRDGKVYANWSASESTGSSGANPFVLKPQINTSSCYTISGRVTDGTNAITNAGINAYKSGGTPETPRYGLTDSLGNYTLCVPSGTWIVQAFAPPPANNFIGSKTFDVSASLGSQDFSPSDTIGSIAGTISIPGTDDDSGIIVMAHGASGSSSATTATNGTYTISGLPYSGSGTPYTLEIMKPGSWSLKERTVTVDGEVTGEDVSVPTLSPVTITLSSAVTMETGIEFHDGTNVRNAHVTIFPGQTSTTTSIPQDTYYLDMFIPGVQKGSLTIAGASYNSTNGTAIVDGTESITVTMPNLYTVSGTVTNPGSTTVNAWISFFKRGSNEPPVGVQTSSNGAYSIKLAAGTYEVTANTPGAYSAPVTLTVSGNSANNNFTLASYSKTISGTVSKVGGGTLVFARIWAIKNGGGFSETQTGTDGTYSLNVNDGTWTLYSVAEGYGQSTSQQVIVSGSNQTNKNFTLTALSGDAVLRPPKMGLMNPSSGGMMVDTEARVRLNVPANALGSGTSSAQLTAQETNDVASTPIGAPLGGKGKEFSATDSTGTPITTFGNEVEIELEYLVSELSDDGIATKDQVEQISNAYWDDTLKNWVTLATTRTYNDESGDAIALADVESDLSNVTSVTFKSKTTHFTTFAPIIPSGATPPDAPTGLAASAGDGQVTLTWNKNAEDDMSSYKIWEANVTEGVLTTLTQASCVGSTCTKIISSLTNGTLYTFQVIAVDTDGNESAGSSSVDSTPVAAGGGEGEGEGESPGGGGSILVNTKSVKELKEITEFIVEVIGEALDIPATGKIQDTTTMLSGDKNVEVTFEKGTAILDEQRKVYTGSMPAPETVVSTISIPSDKELVGEVYQLGKSEEQLFFTKAVTVTFKLPSDITGTEKLKIYYGNPLTSAWEIAGDGGNVYEENGVKYIETEVYHFTNYAVFKDTAVAVEGFQDISNHWAKKYIDKLTNDGVLSGYSATEFGPDRIVTRAELIKMAIKGFRIDVVSPIDTPPFTDVGVNVWYAPYIQAAKAHNVTSGYKDGTFKPNNSITRAEALKILFEASTLKTTSTAKAKFTDVPDSSWFKGYVYSAYTFGVVSGYSETLFKPEGLVSRAEAAKIIFNLQRLKNLKDSLLKITK